MGTTFEVKNRWVGSDFAGSGMHTSLAQLIYKLRKE
jgi:hypothetical protein